MRSWIFFLRDIQADQVERNRTYFPGLDIEAFDIEMKRAIEQEVKSDFQEALPGIRQFHKGARLGVYLAYRYYYQLLSRRTRITNRHKFLLLAKSMIRIRLGLI